MSKLEWPIYCSILYYLREEYYGTALTICDKELGKSSDLPQIVIFRSIALVKYGQFAEALRLLELVRQDSNIAFAASVVLRAAHILANDPDREAIRELDRCISKEWSSTNMEAHYNAVIAYTLLNNYDKAHALTEKYLAANSSNVQYIVIRAFLEYHLGKDANIAEKLFEKGIAEGYPCAYIGMARLLEARRDLTKSRQLLHDLIEKIPTFVPGQIELSKIFLMDRDWRQCIEQVQRTLLLENDCLQVRLLELVYEIVVNGETKMVENNLQDLFEIIEKNEPKNHKLHHQISTLLIRITTSDHGAVEFARKLLDRAISIKKDTEYLADKVRLLLQAEDISLAQKVALEAVEIGAAPNEQVLMGIAQCFMAEGRLDDAAAQMNFVKATYPDISQTSLYMYLTAVQTKEEHKPFERFFEEIKGAVDAHLLALQGAVFGLEYLKMLDPNFLIDVVWQLYDFAPLTPTNATNGILKEIERILALIYDCCPGLLIAKYLLAKAKYLSMDFNEAERLLKNCIDKENTPLEAYLLIAQVYIHKNNYDEAGRCLNIGLSYNFKVREHPLYHLIRAKLQKKSKQIDASIQTLLKAIELPLFKAEQPQKREKLGLMDSDRIAIYLELMDSYQQNGQLVEADGVMNDARSRWAGKSEQQQFVLMEANLKLQRRDINGALAVLASVQPSETNYQAARIKMAEIYLNEKKDKQQFAICFKQLAQNNPTPMAYILLGDAYMNIQEVCHF